MKSKYILPVIIVVILVIGAVVIFTGKHTGNSIQNGYLGSNGSQNPASTAQPTVKPINTNVGAVSGIDLSSLGAEANQSASIAGQDGASDAQAMSSDGTDINSSTDGVNNPIQ